jgi:hypothetical protein
MLSFSMNSTCKEEGTGQRLSSARLGERVSGIAYVGVAADRLDGGLIEVARVTKEAAEAVGVLQTLEDGLDDGLLATLA